MAIELETAELQIETVGVEAAQQALAALGLDVDQANAANAAATDGGQPAPETQPGRPAQVDAPSLAIDLAGLTAAVGRSNELLAAILAAIETRPVHQNPTY